MKTEKADSSATKKSLEKSVTSNGSTTEICRTPLQNHGNSLSPKFMKSPKHSARRYEIKFNLGDLNFKTSSFIEQIKEENKENAHFGRTVLRSGKVVSSAPSKISRKKNAADIYEFVPEDNVARNTKDMASGSDVIEKIVKKGKASLVKYSPSGYIKRKTRRKSISNIWKGIRNILRTNTSFTRREDNEGIKEKNRDVPNLKETEKNVEVELKENALTSAENIPRNEDLHLQNINVELNYKSNTEKERTETINEEIKGKNSDYSESQKVDRDILTLEEFVKTIEIQLKENESEGKSNMETINKDIKRKDFDYNELQKSHRDVPTLVVENASRNDLRLQNISTESNNKSNMEKENTETMNPNKNIQVLEVIYLPQRATAAASSNPVRSQVENSYNEKDYSINIELDDLRNSTYFDILAKLDGTESSSVYDSLLQMDKSTVQSPHTIDIKETTNSVRTATNGNAASPSSEEEEPLNDSIFPDVNVTPYFDTTMKRKTYTSSKKKEVRTRYFILLSEIGGEREKGDVTQRNGEEQQILTSRQYLGEADRIKGRRKEVKSRKGDWNENKENQPEKYRKLRKKRKLEDTIIDLDKNEASGSNKRAKLEEKTLKINTKIGRTKSKNLRMLRM